jgi:transposase InsO family protein
MLRGAFKRVGLRQIFTRLYTPKTNGKAERFIQTAGVVPEHFSVAVAINLQLHYSVLLRTQVVSVVAWINEIGFLCSLTKTAAVKGPP